MTSVIDKIKSSRILSGLTILISGGVIAQVIGLVASPLLSRLYTPLDFGLMGGVMAIVSIFSVIGSLKYELAIVLEKEDGKAEALIKLCFILLLVFSILLASLLVVPEAFLRSIGLAEGLAKQHLVWVVPLVFFSGAVQVLTCRANRLGAYKKIAHSLMLRRLAIVLTQIALGYCGAKFLGLVVGNVVAVVVAFAILMCGDGGLLRMWKEVKSSDLKLVAKDHNRFPLFSAPQNFLNAVSQNLPIYLLGIFYGVEVVGAYWFAMRLLQLPVQVAAEGVRQVFYKEAVELKDKVIVLSELYRKTILILAAGIIPPVIILFILGPDLFSFVFGGEWRVAGEYSRWMFLWVGAGFVTPPATCLFSIFDKQKTFAIYDLSLAVARAISLVVGGVYFDSTTTIVAYSVVGSIFNTMMICYWFYYFKKEKYVHAAKV